MFETLHAATVRYRLRDVNISNADIARHLEARNRDGDHDGFPSCCFFWEGYIAAIRTKSNELAIFHIYGSLQMNVADIGDRIE